MFRKQIIFTFTGDALALCSEAPFMPRLFADGGAGTDGSGAGDGSGGSGNDAGTDPGAEKDSGGDGSGDTKKGDGSGTDKKTFSQADIDAAVSKALADANSQTDTKIKNAVEEASKKAKMTADEKAQYEQQQKEKNLSDRESQIALRELKVDVASELSAKGLPSEAIDFVIAENKDTSIKRIETLKTILDTAVKAEVEKRLKGNPPPAAGGGNNPPSVSDKAAQQFAKALGI